MEAEPTIQFFRHERVVKNQLTLWKFPSNYAGTSERRSSWWPRGVQLLGTEKGKTVLSGWFNNNPGKFADVLFLDNDAAVYPASGKTVRTSMPFRAR